MKLFVDASALPTFLDADQRPRHGITEALALDDDFAGQGFRLVPPPH